MIKVRFYVIILFNVFTNFLSLAQEKPIILNSIIGDTLDLNERDHYRLFKNIQGFQWAVFYLNPKDSITIRICFSDEGTTKDTIIYNYSTIKEIKEYFDRYDNLIFQDSTKQLSKIFAHLGLGGSSFGIAFGLNFSFELESRLLSFRFNYNERMSILGASDPAENIWDLGVLYGISSKSSSGFVSLEGGAGVISGTFHGKYLGSSGGWFGTSHYEGLGFLTVGIPLQAKAFWISSFGFGIGISGFANLNFKQSFWGGMLCIHFGKIQ